MTWLRKYRWVIIILPFLPLVVFMIPKALVIMPEPGEYIPWYSKYTTIPWLIAAFYVYPVTFIANVFGFRPFTPFHVIFVLLYAGAISFLLYRLISKHGS